MSAVIDAPQIWPAPAKINLFLHVVGKRADGYHELQTVFQFLDYADELSFEITQDSVVTRTYDYGFSEERDLCMRAARLLKKQSGCNAGVAISLRKRLPAGAGLGGGSSDAATVLIALNHLWQTGLSVDQLAELGLTLGADVPVFIRGRAAWAEGVGECLTPLDLAENWFLVMNPPVCVSTAEVFANKHLTAGGQMMKIRAFQQPEQGHFGDNQLEPIVRAEYPQVEALFSWMSQFGEPRMSGSGGAIFLPLADRQMGEKILAKKPLDIQGFVAKGVNIHPLYKFVRS